MQKINRNKNFKKTEKRICKALFSLLRKRSLLTIRCVDVIEEARVSESAFYAHHKNMFELVTSIEQNLIQEICLELKKIKAEENSIETSYRRLLLFLHDHLELLMLLRSDLITILMSPILRVEAKKIIFRYWKNYGGIVNDRLFDILMAELIAEIHWWRSEHFHKDQINKHANRLTFFTDKIPIVLCQIVKD